MRRRLIQSTLAVVLVVIAVFGVSLVIVETRTIRPVRRRAWTPRRAAGRHRGRPAAPAASRSTRRSCATRWRQDRYAVIRIPGKRTHRDRHPAAGATSSSGRAEASEGETVIVEEPRSTVTRGGRPDPADHPGGGAARGDRRGAPGGPPGQPARLPAHRPRRDRRAARLRRPAPAPQPLRRPGAGPGRRRPGRQRRAHRPDAHRRAPARRRRLPPAAHAADGALHAAGGDHPHRRPGHGEGGGERRADAGGAAHRRGASGC